MAHYTIAVSRLWYNTKQDTAAPAAGGSILPLKGGVAYGAFGTDDTFYRGFYRLHNGNKKEITALTPT